MEKVQLHQTLHGYQGGHRLLASSSSTLPPEVKRKMLFLSDLSGSSLVEGFEKYLTGYPVREVNAYAFAKTWYADEKSRPGCVWTHTLLIKFPDLAQLRPADLLNSFRRPEHGGVSKRQYEKTLKVSQRSSSSGEKTRSKLSRREISLAGPVLECLYDQTSPVFLGADHSRHIESLFLSIWTQQWPSLRRDFSFCTGSIEGRELEGRPMDLQAVPTTHQRKIKREYSDACLIKANHKNKNIQNKWISLIKNDLTKNKNYDFKKYLWKYGADSNQGRESFKYLSKIYIIDNIENKNVYEKIDKEISFLGKFFPEKEDAKSLKVNLLGYRKGDDERDQIILKKLSRAKYPNAFGIESLRIEKRIQRLCSKHYEQALELLGELLLLRGKSTKRLNSIGEHILEMLIDGIDIESIIDIIGDHPPLLNNILRLRPEIASDPNFWHIDPQLQAKCLETLQSALKKDPNAWSPVIGAAISSGTRTLPRKVEKMLGETGVWALLTWCNRTDDANTETLGPRWERLLRKNPESVENWIGERESLRPHILLTIAKIFTPQQIDLENTGTEVWERSVDEVSPSELDPVSFSKLMVFVLTLGFKSDQGKQLIVLSFQHVHGAILENTLDWRSRNTLRKEFPSLSESSLDQAWGWDLCSKLRRALVEKWLRQSWSPEALLKISNDPEVFDSLMRLFAKARGGAKILENLLEMVEAGRVSPDEAQSEILREIKPT